MAEHDEFTRHRRLLLSVAYRMLGSLAEAEDVVQDAWLRWDAALGRDLVIENPRGFLIQTVSRLAIDRLRSATVRRETYVGPWLPEPAGSMVAAAEPCDENPQQMVERIDTVSVGLLVVLESLSPAERVVFVLREAFGLPSNEIAEIIGKSDTAVRQLARRAKVHVTQRRRRFDSDPARRREATKRFLEAATNGDLAALLSLLDPDATLTVDTDGKVRGPKRPIRTAGNIARLFAAIHDQAPPGTELEFIDVNGQPGAVMRAGGEVTSVFSLEVGDRGVMQVYWIANPAKLTRWESV